MLLKIASFTTHLWSFKRSFNILTTLHVYDNSERGLCYQEADELCPTTGNSSSCYCVPAGQCFAIIQPIDIDNCHFDRYTKDPLELRYTVTNQAGLNASGKIDVRLN